MTEVDKMSRYLVVTHQTALSPDLQRKVSALVAEDPAAEFAVLVPEAPGLPITWEGETVDVARHRAEAARTALEEKAGARVTRTAVGASDPLQAIADELLAHPGYDTLVISTFPPGISRWLKLDLVHRAERKFGRRVIHVVAKSGTQERNAVKFIPAGYHSVTAYLTVADGTKALDFYTRAFGAQVTERIPGPGGKLMHAEFRIGDSVVMLSDEFPQGGTRAPQSPGGASGSLFLYVPDVDAAFRRAVDAGCRATMQPADMFWGDRFGRLVDPFGHHWGLATHKEDLTPAEIGKRAQVAMAQAAETT
jgi:PhnB protein